MPGQKDLFPLYDRIMKGRLAAFLREQREAGETYQSIAWALREKHDLDLSIDTVRRWCQRLEAEAEAAAG